MKVADLHWHDHYSRYWVRYAEILDADNQLMVSVYQLANLTYRVGWVRYNEEYYCDDLLTVQCVLMEIANDHRYKEDVRRAKAAVAHWHQDRATHAQVGA